MNAEASVTLAGGVVPLKSASAKPRRWPLLRHSLVLARRGVINTLRTPEALIDVTLQPIIFLLMFTYIFGGAIAHGSQHDYLEFLLPGILGQTIAMGGIAIGSTSTTTSRRESSTASAACRSPGPRHWSAPSWPTSSATASCVSSRSGSATCWAFGPTPIRSTFWPRACCRSASPCASAGHRCSSG